MSRRAKGPRHPERPDISRVDLIQRAVARPGIISVVRRPGAGCGFQQCRRVQSLGVGVGSKQTHGQQSERETDKHGPEADALTESTGCVRHRYEKAIDYTAFLKWHCGSASRRLQAMHVRVQVVNVFLGEFIEQSTMGFQRILNFHFYAAARKGSIRSS